MANAYQWLGAAGGAQTGVQGVQMLADLLAKNNQQQAAAAELDIRRQNLAGEAEGRQFQREYQQGTLERQARANELAEAKAAAEYGNYAPLAAILNQDPESMRRYEAPPNSLDEALAQLVHRGRAFGGATGPMELGIDQPVRVAGEDIQAGLTPDAQNIIRMMTEINKSRIRPYAEPSPEDEYIRTLIKKEEEGQLLPYEAQQLFNWREQATGMKAKPGTARPASGTSGTPSALVRHYLEKKEQLEAQGLKLSQDDEVALQAALNNLRAPAVRASEEPKRTELTGGELARKQKEDEDQRAEKWNTQANKVYSENAKAWQDVAAFPPGNRIREDTRRSILARLEQLKTTARTPTEQAKVDAAIDQFKRSSAPPLPKPGERGFLRR